MAPSPSTKANDEANSEAKADIEAESDSSPGYVTIDSEDYRLHG